MTNTIEKKIPVLNRLLPLSTCLLLIFLTACAPPEKDKRRISAEELVAGELGLEGGLSPHPPAMPALPPPEPVEPPREITQSGGLPGMGHSAAPNPGVPHLPPGQPDEVMLNYEQVELRQVLQDIADVLSITMVIDPSIGDKITMRTADSRPLRHADLWPLLQLLINDAGISMEKKGAVYHLKKMPSQLPQEIGGPQSNLENSDAPEVMQITPLRYVSLDNALTTIQPLIEPGGRVISLPNLNLLGVVTSPDRLQRINQVLGLVDADPFTHRGMRLYRLNNSKAGDVQADLEKILQAVEGNAPAYQVIGLERINAVLVVAPPRRGFKQVDQWLEILDERNEASGEQVFIYKVRNLKATALASTLSEVFKSEDKDDEDRPRRRPQQPETERDNGQPRPPGAETGQPPAAPADNPPGGDLTAVSAELKVNIVADEDTNTLLVRARPRDYRQLLETIALLDQVPKEVMVNVVIAEVTLSEENRFGIDWSYWVGDRSFVGTNFGIQGADRTRPTSGNADYDTFGFGSMDGFVIGQVGNRLTSMLNLLATDNDVQVLSRPSLLVRNNQEATINVGSDQPTITRINTQNTTNVTTGNLIASNEVQYRQTGIILKVTPHINDDGIINLEVSQEVSQVSKNAGVEGLPAFDQRKIETSVVVRDGSAIVLGGLIETRSSRGNSGIPGLRDIPGAGRLFSAESDETKRTELVVIIVPQIVNPEADNRHLVESFINERMKQIAGLLNEEIAPVPEFVKTPADFSPTDAPRDGAESEIP